MSYSSNEYYLEKYVNLAAKIKQSGWLKLKL